MIAPWILLSVAQASLGHRYLGVYYLGHKLGYRLVSVRPDRLDGQDVVVTEDKLVTSSKFAGQRVDLLDDITSWATPDGRPIRSKEISKSGKQDSAVTIQFGPNSAEIDALKDGRTSHKTVPLPPGPVFQSLFDAARGKLPEAGQTVNFWLYESDDKGFVKCDLKTIGPLKATVVGKEVPANELQITATGLSRRIDIDKSGQPIIAKYNFGVLESSEPEEQALQVPSELFDVVLGSSLKTDKRVDNVLRLSDLRLLVTGLDFSTVPTDPIQTVSQYGGGWLVDVRPPAIANADSVAIADAKAGQPEWLKPSEDVPSDDPAILALAAKITKGSQTVGEGAKAILRYVNHTLAFDSGFGLDRDALQILHDRRGRCTDFAILTTTLMRAAGIPSRLAAGLLLTPTWHMPNSLYYHAWSEIWDGKEWLGMDAVVNRPQMTAAHIKLREGNVDEALSLVPADPSQVTIQVLDYGPR